MKIIKPSFVIEDIIDGEEILKKLEKAGRTCYKSENDIKSGSSSEFIKKILSMGHESVIEHEKITVRAICDRGVSHEIVRHRIGSYSQESTRYCNYGQDKFGKEITVIEPLFFEKGTVKWESWRQAMQNAEDSYFSLLGSGAMPQEARSVLPNSLKTEIVITYNLREWRHFLRIRTSKKAHPQIRELCIPILSAFKRHVPAIFDDIVPE